MTWPDGIAAAIGILASFLITRHQRPTQHRSTTAPKKPQDGERS